MPSDDEIDAWLIDAREHGFPVMVTGVALFDIALGLPSWAVVLIMVGITLPLLSWCACRAFLGPVEAD